MHGLTWNRCGRFGVFINFNDSMSCRLRAWRKKQINNTHTKPKEIQQTTATRENKKKSSLKETIGFHRVLLGLTRTISSISIDFTGFLSRITEFYRVFT